MCIRDSINYFTIDKAMYLVDLPGYGYARVSKAEQQRWGALMETYFAMDLLTLGIQIVEYIFHLYDDTGSINLSIACCTGIDLLQCLSHGIRLLQCTACF